MARKRFLTPASIPVEDTCRGLIMPASQDWLGVFSEALSQTIYAYNYEQINETDLTPEQAAAEAYTRYVAWLTAECASVCPPPTIDGKPIIRLNPSTGKFEQLGEDDEWIEPEGDYAVPPIEVRDEPTEAERICAAATNAAYVLEQLYDETLQMWEDTVAPLAAFEAFGELAGELANAVLTLLLGAFAPFVATAWGIFYATMELLTTDVWTDDFRDRLTCVLQENAIYTDGVVTFDFQAVNGALLSSDFLQNTDILLIGQVLYLTGIIGADGLNLAGETTALEGDCSYCDGWCYTVDLTAVDFSLANVTVYNANGSVFCGSGGAGTWASGTGWTLGRAVGRSFTRSEVTSVEVTAVVNSGTGAPRMQVALFDPQGSRSFDRNTQMAFALTDTVGTQTISWTGSVMVSEISIERCTSTGTTVYKTITLRGNGTNPFGEDNCT